MDRKSGRNYFDSMTNNNIYAVLHLTYWHVTTLPGGHVMQEGGREDVPVELVRHCLLPHVTQTREYGCPALRHELPQKLE